MATCPLCQNILNKKIDPEYYDCGGCWALVKKTEYLPSSEEEILRYQLHNNDVNDPEYQKFTAPITDHILANFTKEHIGLDFGSGTGPVITKVLRDKGYYVIPYDPYFQPDTSALSKKYDFIASCEVFEHFHHPAKEMDLLCNLLNPGGHLVIKTHIYNGQSFPNWYYRKDPTHVFIYRSDTFRYISLHWDLALIHIDERLIVMRKN
ncbi:MAG: class I SAM-dependent methyltransferase [Cryomorphaceae bacterium]|nr:class I SAM-dependent methyltransferase [Cryomorphaceae bacterium]